MTTPTMAGCSLLRNASFLRSCGVRLCEKAGPFSGRVSNIGACNTRSYAVIPNTQEYLKRKGVLEAVNTDIASVTQSKLFAIVCLAGRQHKVTSNDTLVVNSLEAETGSQIFLNKVLLVGSEDFTLIGRPVVSSETVKITATVIEHTRLKKITVFKKKRRKNYKKTRGHRQDSTVLRINEINVTPNLD